MRPVLLALLVLCLLPVSLKTLLPASASALAGQGTPEPSKPFRIFNPSTMAKPTAGYSQVAEVRGGKLVYIAGQVAIDKSGNLVGKDDFRAQVQQIFENLKAAVEAAGGN